MIPLQEFVDRLRRAFVEEVDAVSIPLLKGGCEDYPAYTGAVGEIRGLAKAREALDQLVKSVNSGE